MLKDKLELILITYNRKTFLEKTLSYIFEESSPVKGLDITVLDNNSTDGSSELIDSYTTIYPNLKHVKHNRNIGGNGNIARAFEEARKSYVWVICDDDKYDWTNFSEIETAIEENYDVIFTKKVNNNPADIFYSGSFLPACIYKTANITDTVMTNMFDNIRNMFPHFSILAKNINDKNNFFIPSKDFVLMNQSCYDYNTYIRGMQKSDIPKSKKEMMWINGYMNSLELINDRKTQLFIIENLRHNCKSLFELFCIKISMNIIYHDNFFDNYYSMFKLLSFKQKILFVIAYIKTQILILYKNPKQLKLIAHNNWRTYFQQNNQKTYLKKLSKKYKNKKVLLYGAGLIFDILNTDYKITEMFDIVGICDKKFEKFEENTYQGLKIIKPDQINDIKYDAILFPLYRYKQVIHSLNLKKSKCECLIANYKIFLY